MTASTWPSSHRPPRWSGCGPSTTCARCSARAGRRSTAALIGEDAFDELFISLSPVLAGGDPLTAVTGTLPELVWLELVWVLEGDGMLFLRYRVRR